MEYAYDAALYSDVLAELNEDDIYTDITIGFGLAFMTVLSAGLQKIIGEGNNDSDNANVEYVYYFTLISFIAAIYSCATIIDSALCYCHSALVNDLFIEC